MINCIPFVVFLALLLTACESAYYGAMEKVGIHKRDILIDRIESAQIAQQDGQQQFRSALEQFRSVVDFDAGELDKRYALLNNEYEGALDAAQTISDRIDKVESVAEALFDEWESEIEQYSNERLRRDSAAKLGTTRRQYASLLKAMRGAESSLEPVLATLKDNVLYLKHNLNARAIASLRGELMTIDRDVTAMLAAMQKAIDESDKFINQLRNE